MQHIVPAWDNLPALPWKSKVALLTFEFSKLDQTGCPVKHIFSPGLYTREIEMPAGTFMTGREHLLGHECQLHKGSCFMVAPDGRHYFDAYSTVHTKPGYHAVVYAITDIVARTVHANPDNLRDIAALEKIHFGTAQELIDKGSQVHHMLLKEKELCHQLQ